MWLCYEYHRLGRQISFLKFDVIIGFISHSKRLSKKYKADALPIRVPLGRFLKKAVNCLIITDESLANSILDNLVMHPAGLNVISNICTSLDSKGIWFLIIAHAETALNRSTNTAPLCDGPENGKSSCLRKKISWTRHKIKSWLSKVHLTRKLFGNKGSFASKIVCVRWNTKTLVHFWTKLSFYFWEMKCASHWYHIKRWYREKDVKRYHASYSFEL